MTHEPILPRYLSSDGQKLGGLGGLRISNQQVRGYGQSVIRSDCSIIRYIRRTGV